MGRRRCCCEHAECVYFSDDFEREDNADPGEDWIEVVGNSRIINGHLQVGNGGGALARCAIPHPVRDESMCAITEIVTLTGICRLIVNYRDADNYLYGRYDFENLKLEIWRRASGAESLIRAVDAPTIADAEVATATVQFTGTKLFASISTVNEECFDCAGQIGSGFYAGLMSETGGHEFDSFSVREHDRTWEPSHPNTDCCYHCCNCIAGRDASGFDVWTCIPRTLTITISVTGDFVGTDLDGATITLTNDGDIPCDDVIWSGGKRICGEDFSYDLSCEGPDPKMDLDKWELVDKGIDNYCNHHLINPQTPDESTCLPFELVFGPYGVTNADPPLPGEYCGCLPIPGSGTFTMTVTE